MFNSLAHLKQHQRKVHAKKFTCDLCGYTTARSKSYDIHVLKGMIQNRPFSELWRSGGSNRAQVSKHVCLSIPFIKEATRKGSRERALRVHQRKTKHFIAKLLAQPYRLLHTFSILVVWIVKRRWDSMTSVCFLPFGEGGEAIEGEVTLLFDSSDGWRGVEADCWLNWQINRPIIKCWSSLLIFTTCKKKETMLVHTNRKPIGLFECTFEGRENCGCC